MSVTRYIIVVHGIGEQRKNETALPVVSRFAEARRGMAEARSDTVLSLGTATGQTGKQTSPGVCRIPPDPSPFRPWLEFKGIPQPGGAAPTGEFLGEWDDSGENLRFADLWWADVMQDDIADVGQPPEAWTDAMLTRLKRKDEGAADPGERVQPWVLALLRELCTVVKGLSIATRLRAQELGDLVFTKFLGDVQLYGEYAHCRGQAVRRFHRLMARIEDEHEKRGGGEARYTIVAHSLGSIMSFDALLYAHAKEKVRGKIVRGGPNLPFPGYAREKDLTKTGRIKKVTTGPDMYDVSWVDRVDSFVTLGSPIDKYLILWWLNYTHLNDLDWMNERQGEKIRHFNYCDEQDPVGHNLDVAQGTDAYKAVFESKEDIVFNRYAVPLLAHIKYWRDLDLFKWILARAVDGVDPPADTEPVWFDKRKYRAALYYSYWIVPFVVGLAMFFTTTWAVFAESWHATAVALVTLVFVAWIGKSLIRLFVWWRQIAREKWRDPGGDGAGRGSGEASQLRERKAWLFRFNLATLQILLAAGTGVMCAYVLQAGTDPATSVRSAVVLGLLSLAALSLLVPRLLGLVTGARAASRGWDPIFFASWLLAVVLGGVTWSISRIAFRVPKEIETVNAWLDAAGPDIILTIFVAVAIAAGIVTYVRWTMLASKRHLKLPPGMDSKTQFTAYCAEKMRWNPVDEDSGP